MAQLLDTTIFVDSFRGKVQAQIYLRQQSEIICSLITAAELIQGSRDKQEQAKIELFLDKIKILPITSTIGDKMFYLIKKYSRSHGLEIPDGCIAATALEHKLTLVTANTKHFSFIKNLKLLDWKQARKQVRV